METKELIIDVPEGYEIDRENSTFECIRFKKKELDYETVAEELFFHKKAFFASDGRVISCLIDDEEGYTSADNCTSEKQAEKLLAINKLMNVAKYLNGDWEPNWVNAEETKCYIGVAKPHSIYYAECKLANSSPVYFKTKELARRAVKILGEDVIATALSTDW